MPDSQDDFTTTSDTPEKPDGYVGGVAKPTEGSTGASTEGTTETSD